VEDTAILWFDLWRAYNPDGIRERLEDRKIAFYKCPNPRCERFGYKDKEKEGERED